MAAIPRAELPILAATGSLPHWCENPYFSPTPSPRSWSRSAVTSPSLHPAIGPGRKILRGENVRGLRLAPPERRADRDLVERPIEPRLVDAAVALRLHEGRHHQLRDRHFQSRELAVLLGDVIVFYHEVGSGRRIRHGVLEAIHVGAQKALDGLGLRGGEFRAHHDGVAEELEARGA